MRLLHFGLSVIAILAIVLTSCDQKELDMLAVGQRYYFKINVNYDRPWYILYDGTTDWEKIWDEDIFYRSFDSMRPNEPKGLKVIVYNYNNTIDEFNLPAHGGVIDVTKGSHTILLLNNDTEYIVLNGLDEVVDANASTRSRSRASYLGSQYVSRETNENTVSPPDFLFAINGGEIYAQDADGEVSTLNFVMRPLVYSYLLRYHFNEGLQHVAMARGALAGMAASVFLTDGHTGNETATLLFDIDLHEGLHIIDSERGSGVIDVVVKTFGAPGYPNEYFSRSESYAVNLEVQMTNGRIKRFDKEITRQITAQPRGGVINVFELEITEEDVETAPTGSFDVDVDDWGPSQEIPI